MSRLQRGQRGRVLGLELGGGIRRRLLDLGIVPGTTIEHVMDSPIGDPTCYRVRGAMIALRSDDAELVRVAV